MNIFSVVQREIEADVLGLEYLIPITQIVDWPVIEPQSKEPKVIVLVYRFAFKRASKYVYTFSGARMK